MNKSRTNIIDVISAISPLDGLERTQRDTTLAWIKAGHPLYRSANPDHHLVSYFVPYDDATRSVLLFRHRKAGLWLPPGGHLEEGETFIQALNREMNEELHQSPRFYDWCGNMPLFLTTTNTVGANSHHDVSLWFVVRQDAKSRTWYDDREFAGHQWLKLDDAIRPSIDHDPQMHRFARKLARIIPTATTRD